MLRLGEPGKISDRTFDIYQQLIKAFHAGEQQNRKQLLTELAYAECPYHIGDRVKIGAMIGEIRKILHGESRRPFQKSEIGIPACLFWIEVATLQHGIRFFPDECVFSAMCQKIESPFKKQLTLF